MESWRAVKVLYTMEAMRMEPWKVWQVVADAHNIDEDQDPESDPHNSE